MEPKELAVIRHAMEVQFRHQLYQDVKLPFLHSLGIKHILQGFGNDDVGFIGVMHLWWVNEDNQIIYDNPTNWPIPIKGLWKAEWFDTPEEGMKYAQEIQKDNIYDSAKLQAIMESSIKEMMETRIKRQVLKQIQEQQEDEFEDMEIPEEILWN